MYKKISFLLFLLLIFVTGCANQEKKTDVYNTIIKRDKIIVGTQYEAKPFGFVDKDGKLKGADIDIARELAKRILGDENKVEFKQVTPSTRIQAITTGDVDFVVATMSITPQRMVVVDFSQPYYVAGQAILVPPKSNINSLNDLNNKNVIVVLGTTGERSLRYFAPGAIMQGYRNYADAFSAFKSKKSDALTTDDSLIIGFIMDNPGYKLLPKRITQEPYGIAFKKSEDASILKNNLNRILDDMRTDGFLSKTKKKWGLH